MKILFFRHTLLNRGGDKMIVAHANHLAGAGHDVTIQSARIETIFPLSPLVKTIPIGWNAKFGTLFGAIQRYGEYDHIIADIIPIALLLSLRNRLTTIYYAQDYDEAYYANALQQYFIRFLYWLGFRVRGLNTVAVSKSLEQVFMSRFGHHCRVVENGVDLEIFYRNPDPKLLTLKEGRKSILLFSRSDHRKGFDLARETVLRLANYPCESFEVWTVGEPVTGFPPHLVHRDLGYLSGAELARVMSSADLFLYPSRHEGFPLMVVEAFACGCPVITTVAVSFAIHGDTALVCAIGDVPALVDACQLLLADSTLAERLKAHGSAFAAAHRLQDTLNNFEVAIRHQGRPYENQRGREWV